MRYFSKVRDSGPASTLTVRKKVGYMVAAVAIGLTTAVAIAEVASRLLPSSTHTGRQVRRPGGLFELSDDPRERHRLKWTGIGNGTGKKGHNSAGYRGVEYSVEKPAGVTRIVTLGDSVAYGLGVNAEDTFSKKLEELMNDNSPDSTQVLNLGVPGYNPSRVL